MEGFKKRFMAKTITRYPILISGLAWCLVLGLLVVHKQSKFWGESSLEQVMPILEKPVYDFNGAQAVVAEFPDEFYQPSALDLQGTETKGTMTARRSGRFAVKYISIHGILNHPVQCELTGYRILTGAFAGTMQLDATHNSLY
jgi:hypothetical protein